MRARGSVCSIRDKDNLYLSFKGTNNRVDLAQNSLFYQSPFGDTGAQVHTGLLWKYKRLIKDCEDITTEEVYKDIYVSCHSAGIVSALVLADLALRFPSLRFRHYSFGSPPIGNKEFVALYGSAGSIIESHRITNNQDPIPHLPFVMQDSWQHVGVHKHLGPKFAGAPSLGDHSMAAYIKAITTR